MSLKHPAATEQQLADFVLHASGPSPEKARPSLDEVTPRTQRVMSKLQEIKTAIASLRAGDKALLTAELFSLEAEPDPATLEAALDRGMADVQAGRIRPIEDVKAMLPG